MMAKRIAVRVAFGTRRATKSKSFITETLACGLLMVAGAIGCASSAQDANVAGPTTSAGPGSAVTGSGGAGGSNVPTGSGGATGTGGSATGLVDAQVDTQEPPASLDGGPVVSADAGVESPPDARARDTGAPITESDAGSEPCTGSTLRSGNATVTIAYAGGNRDYIVHVPTSYTGKTRVPLLIDMHGSGQNATNQMGTSGWLRKADTTGFIVVYPNALNARWNAGTCCSPSVEQHVDDVGFLRAVVENVTKDGCIDSKRVYASGLSGGGLMCYRLACEAADIFAAVAPVSGATVFSPCKPSAGVSVVAFRGLSDPLVPYNGGMPLQWYFQGAKADFNQWSMLDQCAGPVTMSHTVCQTNTQCTGGADVTLCSINSGHVLYGDAANAGAAVPDVAWEIFQRHALP